MAAAAGKTTQVTAANFWGSQDERAIALRWFLGLGGTWLILSAMVDLGDTSDLAVALALVVMGAVVLEHGPNVFKELGISTTFK